MRTHRWLAASVLSAAIAVPVVLTPRPAHAEWDPVMHRSDFAVDMYLFSARNFGTALPIIPYVQFEVVPDLFINLKFPIATFYDTGFSRGTLRGALGNPTFSIFYSDVVDDLTWYIGGRVGAPLGLIDDDAYQLALYGAATTMALYDLYLWAPYTIPFGALGGIEYRFASFFVLRAGGDLILYPPVGSRASYYRRNDFDVHLQSKVEAEFQSRIGVGGGAALLAVWLPTVRAYDNAQVSVMPYFAYDSQETFFMRFGALLALDPPLGPAFDRGRVASLYLQLGAHID